MSVLEPIPLEPVDDPGPPSVEVGRRSFELVEGTTRFKVLRTGAIALAFAFVTVIVFVLPVIEARLVSRFVALGVALLGLQFVVGRAAQLSLCHGVFVGIGSYATTISISRYDLPHLAGLAVAPVLGFVAGCVVGLLALRIKATYLGPVTLSVAVTFPMIVKRFGWFTGGSGGLPLPRPLTPPSWFGVTPDRFYKWNHLIIVAIAIGALVLARNVATSPVGLAVRAVAQNPLSAASSGINVRRTRVVAYGWGAAFGALGGGLLVFDTPVVGADSYDLFRSLGYYAAVTVGGAASMLGGVLGAAILIGVPWLIETWSLDFSPNLVLGILLVVSTMVAPGGLAVAVSDFVAGLVDLRHRIPGTDRLAPRPRAGPGGVEEPPEGAAGPGADGDRYRAPDGRDR